MRRQPKVCKCPFCHSPADLIIRKRTKDKLPYSVACSSHINVECFLYSGAEERKRDLRSWDDVLPWYSSKEDAVNSWNTRGTFRRTINKFVEE